MRRILINRKKDNIPPYNKEGNIYYIEETCPILYPINALLKYQNTKDKVFSNKIIKNKEDDK